MREKNLISEKANELQSIYTYVTGMVKRKLIGQVIIVTVTYHQSGDDLKLEGP